MTVKLHVEKNVQLLTVDVKNTTPYLHEQLTNLVIKHGGEHFAFAPGTEFIKFNTHEQITAFLNEFGTQFKVTDVKVIK